MEPTNNPNLQRMIRLTMYRLKQEFGVKCDAYKLVSSTTDYDTGLKSRVISMIQVRKAVKMPEGIRQLQYISPNFTQTQKPFITKGLGWDEVTDVFLFEGTDLRGFKFDKDDWIVWNHKRYDVRAIEELGNAAGWVIGTTQAKGAPPEEFHIRLVEQDLGVEGEATNSVV